MNNWDSSITYNRGAIVSYKNILYMCMAQSTDDEPDTSPTYWSRYQDPVSQIYETLWSLLENHTPLTEMVRVSNRIKFLGNNRDPIKQEVSTADLPELRLVPVMGTPHTQRTSNSSSLMKKFRIDVSTGDQRVDAVLFPIEWEIYRAMAKWAPAVTNLTWKGKPYVVLAKSVDIQEGATETDLQRGIQGWAAMWECEIEMWFTTTDLQGDL